LFAFVAGALAMTRTVHWGRALVVVVVTVLAGIALAIVSAEGLRAGLQ
jgi:pyruvate/2-oxoacid:ferredoxin oxidoreductase alpha subunit